VQAQDTKKGQPIDSKRPDQSIAGRCGKELRETVNNKHQCCADLHIREDGQVKDDVRAAVGRLMHNRKKSNSEPDAPCRSA
jgi:hypothetical protein